MRFKYDLKQILAGGRLDRMSLYITGLRGESDKVSILLFDKQFNSENSNIRENSTDWCISTQGYTTSFLK